MTADQRAVVDAARRLGERPAVTVVNGLLGPALVASVAGVEVARRILLTRVEPGIDLANEYCGRVSTPAWAEWNYIVCVTRSLLHDTPLVRR